MNRMLHVLLGTTFGFLVGALLADVAGALLGMLLGLTLTMAWLAVGRTTRSTEGSVALREERILCMPQGAVADCTFVVDAARGRWLDVQSCSLCQPPGGKVRCSKHCLDLIRDALPAGR